MHPCLNCVSVFQNAPEIRCILMLWSGGAETQVLPAWQLWSASPALSTLVSSSSFCSTPKQPTRCQGNWETDGIGNNPRKAEGRSFSVLAYWKLYRWRCICSFKNPHCQSHPNKLQAFMKSMFCSFMWKVDYLCYNASDNLSYMTFIWLLIWDLEQMLRLYSENALTAHSN